MADNQIYERLTMIAYMPIYHQVMKTALELDVFSRLSEPKTASVMAQENGWDAKNTEIFLNALHAMGFIRKDGDVFSNTEESERYLTSSGPDSMVGFLLLFMKDNAGVPDMEKRIRAGTDPSEEEESLEALDLSPMAAELRAAQMGRRQQEVLEMVRGLPENNAIRRVLDIGSSTGMIGLSVIRDMPGRTGVLFDIQPFVPLMEESIRLEGLAGRAEARGGDFMTDDLGGEWDLILAVAIMGFVGKRRKQFMRRIYDALRPGGVMLCIAEGVVKPDYSGPWDAMLGFLPFLFRGKEILTMDGETEKAAEEAGFLVDSKPALMCSGNQQVLILRKPNHTA